MKWNAISMKISIKAKPHGILAKYSDGWKTICVKRGATGTFITESYTPPVDSLPAETVRKKHKTWAAVEKFVKGYTQV